MSKKAKTRLTPKDYEQDLPPAGSSDKRYSSDFDQRMDEYLKEAEAKAAAPRR